MSSMAASSRRLPDDPQHLVAPAVETSIAVEDAVENRGLYRVFVSRLFERGFRHYSATIAPLSPPSGLERVWMRDRAR